MGIRFFDVLFSLLGILFLTPFFLLISILIIIDSKGGIFFFQTRVGKNSEDFSLVKFRTMISDPARNQLLTIGKCDERITKVGYYLRKYKVDELTQLFNVLLGNMSIVGPRPEVRKYVNLYNEDQRIILSIKPGITDYASIKFKNENDILALSDNPEKTYIEEIMPAKINLNMTYINDPSLRNYFRILYLTIKVILKNS